MNNPALFFVILKGVDNHSGGGQHLDNIFANKKTGICNNSGYLLVPGTRIELVQPIWPRDFKSLASTSSATQAQSEINYNILSNFTSLKYRFRKSTLIQNSGL
jgi:hypothetical protein